MLDDPASGQITRVVVSVGGMGGLGDKLFAVPYHELQRDSANDTLVLNANSDLAHAFNNDNWQALGNQMSTASASPATNSEPATDTSSTSSASVSTPASTPATDTSATTSPASSSTSASASSDTNPAISAPASSDTTTAK